MNFNPMTMPQNQFMRQQPINPTQFKQFLPNLNDNMLQQLTQKALSQGISPEQIAIGMNFINSLRNAP